MRASMRRVIPFPAAFLLQLAVSVAFAQSGGNAGTRLLFDLAHGEDNILKGTGSRARGLHNYLSTFRRDASNRDWCDRLPLLNHSSRKSG